LRLAIASGKGGTGKTTIAVNLAAVAAAAGIRTRYLDCDVEEPNGHIFLRPVITGTREITLPVPQVDEALCDACGECSRLCRFGAIVRLGGKAMTFPELCHSCGGCRLVCPTGAISEVPRLIGRIEQGRSDGINFVHGILRIGEAKSPPLIREVLKSGCENAGANDLLIIDSPPGAACPAVNSMRGADLVLLVTEPTPFGLHDLRIAVEMTARLSLPFAVVINRHGSGDERVERYCAGESIKVLARIPDDRRAAESYSRGNLIAVDIPRFNALFSSLLNKVLER
jgi:MinD superfamily P-loop ATPase